MIPAISAKNHVFPRGIRAALNGRRFGAYNIGGAGSF
jgi:hypothetical protein